MFFNAKSLRRESIVVFSPLVQTANHKISFFMIVPSNYKYHINIDLRKPIFGLLQNNVTQYSERKFPNFPYRSQLSMGYITNASY